MSLLAGGSDHMPHGTCTPSWVWDGLGWSPGSRFPCVLLWPRGDATPIPMLVLPPGICFFLLTVLVSPFTPMWSLFPFMPFVVRTFKTSVDGG